jgi:hypothetical protein
MLACFGLFRFGPKWKEALCMFDKHVLEAMLARLRSKSDAGSFWDVLACFALAQHGKRPCACLSKTVYKRCWHVLACFAVACARNDAGTFTFSKQCWHVLYVSGQVLFSSFVVVAPVAVGQAWLCWFCTMCLSRLH